MDDTFFAEMKWKLAHMREDINAKIREIYPNVNDPRFIALRQLGFDVVKAEETALFAYHDIHQIVPVAIKVGDLCETAQKCRACGIVKAVEKATMICRRCLYERLEP